MGDNQRSHEHGLPSSVGLVLLGLMGLAMFAIGAVVFLRF